MGTDATYHIVPASGGEWTIETDEAAPTTNVYPTQGLAVAKAWELARDHPSAEVVVHRPDGTIDSNLLIRRRQTATIDEEFLDEAGEDALRREAMRRTPSRAELHELIGRLPPSSVDYSMEDDELPC